MKLFTIPDDPVFSNKRVTWSTCNYGLKKEEYFPISDGMLCDPLFVAIATSYPHRGEEESQFT